LNFAFGLAAGRSGQPFDFGKQDGPGAADASPDGDCCEGAIFGAGAALHAGIEVMQASFSIFKVKNGVRTNLKAHPAARAFLGVIAECHYVLKIAMFSHAASPKKP